ncbi:MAG: hypothetical protein GX085_04315 [Firmicutes bacterium]|jgi:hypothetical protein|nr:hypothetical protein [Bacillota bacterium]
MKKAGIVVLLFILIISTGSPVQAKGSRITFDRDFTPEYAACTNTPLFARVELAEPVRRGPSAESFIATLAQDEKKARKIGGGILTGAGLLFILGSAHADYNKSAPLVGGIILTGFGLFALTVPGYVEAEYKRIMKTEDPQAREEAAYTVLMHTATKAKLERISSAISNAALCFYYFTKSNDRQMKDFYQYSALLFGSLSAYYFLVESPAERMLKEYKEGQKARGHFAIMPRPDGSIAAVYTLTF